VRGCLRMDRGLRMRRAVRHRFGMHRGLRMCAGLRSSRRRRGRRGRRGLRMGRSLRGRLRADRSLRASRSLRGCRGLRVSHRANGAVGIRRGARMSRLHRDLAVVLRRDRSRFGRGRARRRGGGGVVDGGVTGCADRVVLRPMGRGLLRSRRPVHCVRGVGGMNGSRLSRSGNRSAVGVEQRALLNAAGPGGGTTRGRLCARPGCNQHHGGDRRSRGNRGRAASVTSHSDPRLGSGRVHFGAGPLPGPRPRPPS
jgi:hypothetical protein